MNSDRDPRVLNRTSRIFYAIKKVFESYIGYLVLLAIVLGQRHQNSIKSNDIMCLYYTERVESALVGMESSQRGYLFAGDPDMQKDFTIYKAGWLTWSKNLAKALDGDKTESVRFHEAQSLADAKIAEMETTISMFNSGRKDDALRFVLTHQGQRFMTEIREILREIRSEKEIEALSVMSYSGLPGWPWSN